MANTEWSTEDAYWRTNYKNRPYASSGTNDYDYYQPGYRYGYESAKVAIDARPPISATGSTGTAAPAAALGPVEIHIHPPAGTSEQLIARMVAEEIRRLEAQRGAQARSRLTDRD